MAFAEHMVVADKIARQGLGGTVRYTPSVGAAVDVQGIFDAAYVDANAGGHAGVSSCAPKVFLTLADLPSDPSDDEPRVTVDGVEYEVAESQPDGLGGVLLILHRV